MITFLNTTADKWFTWQFAMLWQTAVLIAIIWMADVLIRKWAHPQVRYALWMLVLVKLLIPPTFTSPASVTSHIPAAAQKAVISLSSSPVKGEYSNEGRGLSVTPASEPQFETSQTESAANGTQASCLRDSQRGLEARVPLAAEPPVVSLSRKVWAMFIWLAGIIVLSTWLILRLSGLRKEYLAGHPGLRAGVQSDTDWMPGQARHDNGGKLPERFNEQLQAAAQKLNLKRLPTVILSDKVSCPAVFGVFRPVLLMPAEKFKTMTKQDTEHILLHELAHIKRGDLLVHAVYMMLQILYWFNPLLWMIRRTLQNLRELCCDATVAKLLREDTAAYRQTLLETARQLLAEPVEPGLGLLGLFENSNWLVTRLQWLEKNTWKNRPWRIVTIIAIVALMVTCVLPMANRTKELATEEDTESKEFIKTLDNGVTVELVGISEYPSEGKQWWAPDGTPLSMQIKTSDSSSYPSDNPGYEFVFRKAGDKSFKIHSVKGSNVNSGITVLKPADLIGYRVHIKSRYDKTDIKIASPSGRWQTVHTSAPQPQGSTSATVNGKTLVMAAIGQAMNTATVSCSDELGYKDATRIIAIDPAGNEYTGTILADAGVNNIRQRTIQFALPITTSIAKVCFQTCPWEYYTFKDVALRPRAGSQKAEVSSQKPEQETMINPEIEQLEELFDAVRKGNLSKVKESISQGFDVNTADNNGKTMLHEAGPWGQAEIARLLIEAGANIDQKDQHGQTPLFTAADYSHQAEPTAKLLIEHGADVTLMDDKGMTPLHYACTGSMCEMLVEKGADIHARNNEGWTPLHYDCNWGRLSAVQYLLDKGADIEARDDKGRTPLMLASANANFQVVEYLIDHGANPSITDNQGKTALHWAVMKDKDQIRKLLDEQEYQGSYKQDAVNKHYKKIGDTIQMLLTNGAEITAKDDRGMTALDYAKAASNEAAVLILFNGNSAQNSELKTQNSEHRTQNSEFIATLPNGVIVELVGLCSGLDTKERIWWYPDGKVADSNTFQIYNQDVKPMTWQDKPGRQFKYAYLIKVRPVENTSLDTNVSVGDRWHSNSISDKSVEIGYAYSHSGNVDNFPEIGGIKIAVASGDFEQFESKVYNGSINDVVILSDRTTNVTISGPRDYSEYTEKLVDVSVTSNKYKIAVSYELTDGTVKEARDEGRMGGPHITSFFGEFNPLIQHSFRVSDAFEKIKKFIIKYRKYEVVTFKNVSLRPGGKTEVEIEQSEGSRQKAEEKTMNSELRTPNSEWIIENDSGQKPPSEKPQIVIEAKVFTIQTTHKILTDYLKELFKPHSIFNRGVKSMLLFTDLTDAQSSELADWMASLAGTSVLACPKVKVYDGETVQMGLTSKEKFIIAYENDTPKTQEVTAGVQFKFTPKLQKEQGIVSVAVDFNKTDVMDVMKQTDDAGRDIAIPALGNKSMSNTINVPQGKTMLWPVAGIISPDPNAVKTEQILLLIKADVEKQ